MYIYYISWPCCATRIHIFKYSRIVIVRHTLITFGIVIICIMLHFYRAIFLTSQVIQRHTHTSIRIKKNVKRITKK